ncbi:hypothetical protein KY284_033170 [Solanum tuberosum]|nr:hypothetical protein KY284_033170 [Solanum tuberosum]
MERLLTWILPTIAQKAFYYPGKKVFFFFQDAQKLELLKLRVVKGNLLMLGADRENVEELTLKRTRTRLMRSSSKVIYALFQDLDFTFLEMNPFILVEGKPYPLDMRGELDDTASFKNFKKWGNLEFPLPFGRVMNATYRELHSRA